MIWHKTHFNDQPIKVGSPLFSGILIFWLLGAHAKFQNPMTTPSRRMRRAQKERGKREKENNGH